MIKIINIYDAKEIDFSHNGLAVLDKCIRCEIIEELNGLYELELEYPIFDKKSNYLIKDNIIKAPTPDGEQLFRIYRPVKNMGLMICYAKHIFYDLLDNFIEDARPTELNANDALKYILKSTQYEHNFKGYSNISKKNTAYYIRKNPVEILLSENENSFLNRWGGELKRDNFNIKMLNNIGADKGLTISYGKNLLGLEEDLDTTEVVTRIMPTGLNENDQVVMLDEKYIDSPNINKYPFPKIRHLHFGEIKVDTEENISLTDVKNKLRQKVRELYEVEHADLPKINYRVNFVELSKTEEYKNYNCLETVNLGDIVTVKHKKMNIDIRQKVIRYKWDGILNKYLEIELGSFKENLNGDLNNLNNSIDELRECVEYNNKKFRSKFEQTEEHILMTVEEINKTNSKLEITANAITADVEDKYNKTNSKIEQTANSITSTVSSNISKTREDLNKNIDNVNSNLNNLNADLNKKILDSNSKIEQTASRITSSVDSKILDVNGKIRDCNSKIEQNADNISLVVNGGQVNGNALVSAINMSDRKIGMKALNIDLDGYVTVSDLKGGRTTIDGGCIDCSTIDADAIGARISKVSDYVIVDGGRTASINGIGTKQRGDGYGYLQLISSSGVMVSQPLVDEDFNKFATQYWVKNFVDDRLEKFKQVLEFLNKSN